MTAGEQLLYAKKSASADDLVVPALVQELNLARRACWRTKSAKGASPSSSSSSSLSSSLLLKELIVTSTTSIITSPRIIPSTIATNKSVTNDDENVPLHNSVSIKRNGANCLKKPKNVSYNNNNENNNNNNNESSNCDSTVMFKNCTFLCQLLSNILFQFTTVCYHYYYYFCILSTIHHWCNNLHNTSNNNNNNNNNKNSKTRLKIPSKCKIIHGNEMNCSSSTLFIILISFTFLCIGNIAEARPNQSSIIARVLNGDGVESSKAQISGHPNLAVIYPKDDFGDVRLKRSTERTDPPPQSAGIEERSNDGGDGEHTVESYPVAQVEFDRVKTPFIIGLWILSASIAKIGFHMTPKLHKIFPESCLLIVVGVVIGIALYFGTNVEVSPMTPNTFFFYMLPPIILDAGYFMPNRLFFDNLGTILLMAVVGTIFNIVTIGASLWACGLIGMYNQNTPFLDVFLFSSLISAVDPVAVLAVFEEIHVNEVLYIVVFGESLLNDAVTVVLYHMMEAYNEIGGENIKVSDIASGVASFFVVAFGGTIIGVIWGFLTGLVTRFTDHVRVIEPIFIFVMAYLAYLNAEIFHMSGILAITFCGITMKNYVESNISQKSHTTVKYALKMISSSSETVIFMFLGVATVNDRHEWDTAFILLTIFFCSVYRIIGIIILTFIANRFRLHKLSNVDQFVMSYGGLRGAVAFALVLLIDERMKLKKLFVTTTIAVIYFTVFIQGITIKPLVKFLNVKRASKKKPTMNERIHERFMDHLMAGIEDIVGKTGNYNVRDKFKRFDNRFIRPLLIRDLKGAEPKILETYSKLTMKDAMEVMRRNPSTIGQMSGTESMSALFRNYTTNLGGSPSFTNLETCSRNLDMHELDYNPSKKDLTDARIHHLLAEELKPYRRHRRLSYSRHAVDDRDLSTQVNYKMHMNIRRMLNDRKHHKRSKRGSNKQDGIKQNHVSFHDFQQNGTNKQLSNGTKKNEPHYRKLIKKHSHNSLNKYRRLEIDYINEVLNESSEGNPTSLAANGPTLNEDWDDGLTFTAKSSPDSDRANNNSLIAHIQNLPGFDSSKARIVKTYTSRSASPEKITPDIGPTAAELILPWRRDRSYQSFVVAGDKDVIPEEDKNAFPDSDGERRVATPTATESQLPWKRNEDETEDGGAIQQNEFPAWASNKEYLAYNSPSATFLGGLSKPKQAKSVIGLFRRESSGSGSVIGAPSTSDNIGSDPSLAPNSGSNIGSNSGIGGGGGIGVTASAGQSTASTPGVRSIDKRSASITGNNIIDAHSGPFPVTASHRRNTRRGSMLELSGNIIPEENGHSKSLCEQDDDDNDEWNRSPLMTTSATNSLMGGIGGGAGGGNGIGGILGLSNSGGGLNNTINSISNEKNIHDSSVGGNSTKEPLLPKSSTPKPIIRRSNPSNQLTAALLTTSNSTTDSDVDDDDDEEEDFDVYDDDHIVNTAISSSSSSSNRRNATNKRGQNNERI